MKLRPATLSDSAFLYRLRADDETRWASLDQNPIDPVHHEAWLEKTLANPSQRTWVAERLGCKMGSLRFALDSALRVWREKPRFFKGGLVSIVVEPAYRGHGIGREMLALGDAEAKALGLELLVAHVRITNPRSLVLFLKAGYLPWRMQDGVLTLEKELPMGNKEGA